MAKRKDKRVNESNFKKGSFIVSRSLYESEVWGLPLPYLKVWMFLLGMANHADAKAKGFNYKRGQVLTSSEQILKQFKLSGSGKDLVNSKTIKNILRSLKMRGMIETKKIPRGLLVTLCNYDNYQNLDNYFQQPKPKPKKKIKEKSPDNPEHAEFISYFYQMFMNKTGEKYSFNGGKDGTAVKSLLKDYDLPKLKGFCNKYFDTQDKFILDAGFSIFMFKFAINKLITHSAPTEKRGLVL